MPWRPFEGEPSIACREARKFGDLIYFTRTAIGLSLH